MSTNTGSKEQRNLFNLCGQSLKCRYAEARRERWNVGQDILRAKPKDDEKLKQLKLNDFNQSRHGSIDRIIDGFKRSILS